MNRLYRRLLKIVSRALEADERDVVCGDLLESGETGGEALRDVLGLVIRRQAALWADWRPWLALVGLVPLGLLLSLLSRSSADGSAIYIWLYLNNWTSTYLTNTGARFDLIEHSLTICMGYLTLFCWSWTTGLVLGSLARRTIWVNGVLFCLVLSLGALLGAPQHLASWLFLPRARDYPGNGTVFSLPFYRFIFPLIVQMVLFFVPSLWGMRQGCRLGTLPSLPRTILWGSAMATMIALVTQNSLWWQLRIWDIPFPFLPHLPSLAPLALAGPVGYIVTTAIWRHRFDNSVSC